MVKIIFYILCLYVLTSCSSNETPISRSYIAFYVSPERLEPSIKDNSNISIVIEGKPIWLDMEEHNRLSSFYGDTVFNRAWDLCYPNNVISDTCTGIDIVCNRNYDNEHLAGASLSDICQITYTSIDLAEMVKNDYSDRINIKNETLITFNKKDHSLLDKNIKFMILTEPLDKSGKYTFTIKYFSTENGLIGSSFDINY